MILWKGKVVPEKLGYVIYSHYRMALILEQKAVGLVRLEKSKETGEWGHSWYGYYFNLRRHPLWGYRKIHYDGDWYTFGMGWIQFSWQDHWVM